jgi:hypothetical protein
MEMKYKLVSSHYFCKTIEQNKHEYVFLFSSNKMPIFKPQWLLKIEKARTCVEETSL